MLFGAIKGYLNVRAQIELGEWTEGVLTGLKQGEKRREKLTRHMWHMVDRKIEMDAIPVVMGHNWSTVLC